MERNQKIVCISGMERSGTSMVSRIVNLLGVYLGGLDDLIMETEYNQKGCWEHKTLLEISDSILARFGGDTHNRPDFPDGWVNDPRIVELEAQARSMIVNEFAGHGAWGWKDTRCSLIMPFWQRLLPDMEYVICIRNPADVAKSVVTRKWVSSFTEAYYIWYMYTSSIIRYTSGRRRVFVFYEDFMGKDSMRAVGRLAEFLGPEYVERMRWAATEIEAFITKGLQHHETPVIDTLKDAGMPLSIKAYYLILTLLGKGGVQPLDGVEAEQLIDALSLHEDREAATITELQKELAAAKRELAVNENKDAQIKAILHSASWQITAPLRKVVDTFKKPK